MSFVLLLVITLTVTSCAGATPARPTAPSAPPPTDTAVAPTATTAPPPTDTPLPPTAAAAPRTLTLMTHDSFAASEDVIAQFEKENNAKLKILKSGDAGAALNQAILSKGNPLGDVFFGVDNTFFSRAISADIFVPYESPELANIPDKLKLDPQHRLNPADFGDVCLNYDKAWFEKKGLAPPQTLEDLIKPEYKNLTVVENPATSSPGLAFLIATVGHFGEEGYLDYWKQLRDNGVLVTDGWESAYWGQFSAASDGDRPIVVSYATSPAAEVFFSEGKYKEPPTGNVLGEGACFRQIEFVGILRGTKNQDLAEKFVDFMLSKTFQEDIPLNMWVFPANEQASLPDVFQFAEVPPKPTIVSPEDIAKNRETWIEAWTETVLR
jgi:thiamine transport system substrate-binding protein